MTVYCCNYLSLWVSVETGSGQPGHIFSGSSGSDRVYNLSWSNPDALPPRYGGLGIINPILIAAEEYSASCHITEPLSQFILDRGTNSAIVKTEQLSRKSAIRNSKSSNYSDRFSSLRTHLDPPSQRALDLASAKGASNWLTTRLLQEHGFALHKFAFHDAVALRYGWSLQRTPAHCACGTSFSVEHALSCPKGGLPSIRHNEIRDLTATLFD